jgi:hypothetical protein
MQIIAKSGEDRFLATMDGQLDGLACVIDLEQGLIFRPFNLQSILARGYWEEHQGTQAELDALLSQVEPQRD